MKKKTVDFIYQTLLLTLGSILCALAVKGFLVPQGFLARGLTGVALLIYYKHPIVSIGLLYLLINVPVFILGWRFVGTRFMLYSLWGMVIYSLMLYLITFRIEIHDKLLCALVAGALSGIGMSVILRSYGSSGGSDILCVIMNKYFSITLGMGSTIINASVLAIMALLFPIENVLYTLVFVVASTCATNMAFHGLSKRRAALIISEKWKEIAYELTNTQRLGITFINGQGGYQQADKTIIYSVINRKKISALKRTVLDIDPGAFIALMVAEDVTGLEVGNQPHW